MSNAKGETVPPSKEVHVAFLLREVVLSEAEYRRLADTLPPAERERLGRRCQPRDRVASLLGRLLLRWLLSRYLPASLGLCDLRYTPAGKPTLPANVDVSISHTAGCVVCAVAANIRVGVDVEKQVPMFLQDYLPVMPTWFQDRVRNSQAPEREFYRAWAQLESVLKAMGSGLGGLSDEFFYDDGAVYCQGQKWILTPLAMGYNYFCYMATDAVPSVVHFHQPPLSRLYHDSVSP